MVWMIGGHVLANPISTSDDTPNVGCICFNINARWQMGGVCYVGSPAWTEQMVESVARAEVLWKGEMCWGARYVALPRPLRGGMHQLLALSAMNVLKGFVIAR
jgi:hypothetical protein